MKIMICGSMAFAKEMKDIKRKLEKLGHKVSVPVNIDTHLKNSKFVDSLEENLKHCIKNKTVKKCFDLIAKSDAILVLNFKRNGIEGYIGASGLMEIGLAYYLGKKIFLYNNLPSYHYHRWAHEIHMVQPIIINGNLTKIKQTHD